MNEPIDSGNLLTLLDELPISAVFNDSYTLYSQPALMEEWIGVLSTTLQSRPVDLLSRKGVLFDTKQLSVSLYNNGTINGHGRIGVNFGWSIFTEHICSHSLPRLNAQLKFESSHNTSECSLMVQTTINPPKRRRAQVVTGGTTQSFSFLL